MLDDWDWPESCISGLTAPISGEGWRSHSSSGYRGKTAFKKQCYPGSLLRISTLLHLKTMENGFMEWNLMKNQVL